MGTKAIREALRLLVEVAEHPNTPGTVHGTHAAVRAEVEAIERASKALVRWNDGGQALIDIDAARGFGVIESIAKDAP